MAAFVRTQLREQISARFCAVRCDPRPRRLTGNFATARTLVDFCHGIATGVTSGFIIVSLGMNKTQIDFSARSGHIDFASLIIFRTPPYE
jgi:hypothetical protein